jgi:hypothetical protein
MLSQIEVLDPTPRIAAGIEGEPVHVAINVSVASTSIPPKVTFTVMTPGLGVSVDSKDPAILIVNPGSYFLDFTVVDDTFGNPALILSTPFGPFSIPRTGTNTVTLSDTNTLSLGEGEQLYSFTFFFGSGPRDPTIVNTPDPI